MKHKKLFPLLLICSMFLTACDNFNTIKKNHLIVETLDTNNTSSSKSKQEKILSEEEAKLKSLETLEQLFDVKLYLTEVDCTVYFNNPATLKTNLNKPKPADNNIASNTNPLSFDNSKSALENGTYSVAFYSKKRQNSTEKYFDYFTELDAKTGELLSFSHYTYVADSNSKLDMEDSEGVAREFIEKNNIGGINSAKIVDKSDKLLTKTNTYTFTFEDMDSSSKKVTIGINVNSEKVTSLSIGLMTVLPGNY